MVGPRQEGENPEGLKTQERIGSSRAANHRRPDERTPGQVQTPEGAFESSVAETARGESLRKFAERRSNR
jgi:hypothetical protein